MVQVNLTASTGLHSASEFRNLVIKQTNGAVVRLQDVANVTLGAEDYESEVGFDGKQAVYIGVQVAPAANLLEVVRGVRKIWPDIQAQLPRGSERRDRLQLHRIRECRDLRGRAEPDRGAGHRHACRVHVPRFGAFVADTDGRHSTIAGRDGDILLALGYSINLLTLLALVLGIGLVVDDAIIVVENVSRHLEEGVAPIPAAIAAARELGWPIIAMTVVLGAVYVPIGFQGGLTGALFAEFAFALVGSVTVSGVVALTLSPMLCSLLFKPPIRSIAAGKRNSHVPSITGSIGCRAPMSGACMEA